MICYFPKWLILWLKLGSCSIVLVWLSWPGYQLTVSLFLEHAFEVDYLHTALTNFWHHFSYRFQVLTFDSTALTFWVSSDIFYLFDCRGNPSHCIVTLSVFLCLCVTVIPEVPQITQVEFVNSSIAAVLQWNTSESSVHVRPYIRLSKDNGSWVKWCYNTCNSFAVILQHQIFLRLFADELVSWWFLGNERGSDGQRGSDKSGQPEAPGWISVPDKNM